MQIRASVGRALAARVFRWLLSFRKSRADRQRGPGRCPAPGLWTPESVSSPGVSGLQERAGGTVPFLQLCRGTHSPVPADASSKGHLRKPSPALPLRCTPKKPCFLQFCKSCTEEVGAEGPGTEDGTGVRGTTGLSASWPRRAVLFPQGLLFAIFLRALWVDWKPLLVGSASTQLSGRLRPPLDCTRGAHSGAGQKARPPAALKIPTKGCGTGAPGRLPGGGGGRESPLLRARRWHPEPATAAGVLGACRQRWTAWGRTPLV